MSGSNVFKMPDDGVAPVPIFRFSQTQSRAVLPNGSCRWLEQNSKRNAPSKLNVILENADSTGPFGGAIRCEHRTFRGRGQLRPELANQGQTPFKEDGSA